MPDTMYQVQVLTCGQWHTYQDGFDWDGLGRAGHPGTADGLADSVIHTGAQEARVVRLRDRKIAYTVTHKGERYY